MPEWNPYHDADAEPALSLHTAALRESDQASDAVEGVRVILVPAVSGTAGENSPELDREELCDEGRDSGVPGAGGVPDGRGTYRAAEGGQTRD